MQQQQQQAPPPPFGRGVRKKTTAPPTPPSQVRAAMLAAAAGDAPAMSSELQVSHPALDDLAAKLSVVKFGFVTPATIHELKLCIDQVKEDWEQVQKAELLPHLMKSIRRLLWSSLDRAARCQLLELLETYNRGWAVDQKSLQYFAKQLRAIGIASEDFPNPTPPKKPLGLKYPAGVSAQSQEVHIPATHQLPVPSKPPQIVLSTKTKSFSFTKSNEKFLLNHQDQTDKVMGVSASGAEVGDSRPWISPGPNASARRNPQSGGPIFIGPDHADLNNNSVTDQSSADSSFSSSKVHIPATHQLPVPSKPPQILLSTKKNSFSFTKSNEKFLLNHQDQTDKVMSVSASGAEAGDSRTWISPGPNASARRNPQSGGPIFIVPDHADLNNNSVTDQSSADSSFAEEWMEHWQNKKASKTEPSIAEKVFDVLNSLSKVSISSDKVCRTELNTPSEAMTDCSKVSISSDIAPKTEITTPSTSKVSISSDITPKTEPITPSKLTITKRGFSARDKLRRMGASKPDPVSKQKLNLTKETDITNNSEESPSVEKTSKNTVSPVNKGFGARKKTGHLIPQGGTPKSRPIRSLSTEVSPVTEAVSSAQGAQTLISPLKVQPPFSRSLSFPAQSLQTSNQQSMSAKSPSPALAQPSPSKNRNNHNIGSIDTSTDDLLASSDMTKRNVLLSDGDMRICIDDVNVNNTERNGKKGDNPGGGWSESIVTTIIHNESSTTLGDSKRNSVNDRKEPVQQQQQFVKPRTPTIKNRHKAVLNGLLQVASQERLAEDTGYIPSKVQDADDPDGKTRVVQRSRRWGGRDRPRHSSHQDQERLLTLSRDVADQVLETQWKINRIQQQTNTRCERLLVLGIGVKDDPDLVMYRITGSKCDEAIAEIMKECERCIKDEQIVLDTSGKQSQDMCRVLQESIENTSFNHVLTRPIKLKGVYSYELHVPTAICDRAFPGRDQISVIQQLTDTQLIITANTKVSDNNCEKSVVVKGPSQDHVIYAVALTMLLLQDPNINATKIWPHVDNSPAVRSLMDALEARLISRIPLPPSSDSQLSDEFMDEDSSVSSVFSSRSPSRKASLISNDGNNTLMSESDVTETLPRKTYLPSPDAMEMLLPTTDEDDDTHVQVYDGDVSMGSSPESPPSVGKKTVNKSAQPPAPQKKSETASGLLPSLEELIRFHQRPATSVPGLERRSVYKEASAALQTWGARSPDMYPESVASSVSQASLDTCPGPDDDTSIEPHKSKLRCSSSDDDPTKELCGNLSNLSIHEDSGVGVSPLTEVTPRASPQLPKAFSINSPGSSGTLTPAPSPQIRPPPGFKSKSQQVRPKIDSYLQGIPHSLEVSLQSLEISSSSSMASCEGNALKLSKAGNISMDFPSLGIINKENPSISGSNLHTVLDLTAKMLGVPIPVPCNSLQVPNIISDCSVKTSCEVQTNIARNSQTCSTSSGSNSSGSSDSYPVQQGSFVGQPVKPRSHLSNPISYAHIPPASYNALINPYSGGGSSSAADYCLPQTSLSYNYQSVLGYPNGFPFSSLVHPTALASTLQANKPTTMSAVEANGATSMGEETSAPSPMTACLPPFMRQPTKFNTTSKDTDRSHESCTKTKVTDWIEKEIKVEDVPLPPSPDADDEVFERESSISRQRETSRDWRGGQRSKSCNRRNSQDHEGADDSDWRQHRARSPDFRRRSPDFNKMNRDRVPEARSEHNNNWRNHEAKDRRKLSDYSTADTTRFEPRWRKQDEDRENRDHAQRPVDNGGAGDRSTWRRRNQSGSDKAEFRDRFGYIQPSNAIREPIGPITPPYILKVVEEGQSRGRGSPCYRRRQFATSAEEYRMREARKKPLPKPEKSLTSPSTAAAAAASHSYNREELMTIRELPATVETPSDWDRIVSLGIAKPTTAAPQWQESKKE